MINWFNIPDEGLSNGGLFEVKELEVTENGTYETKGEMYNKVTVNVSGGGGETWNTVFERNVTTAETEGMPYPTNTSDITLTLSGADRIKVTFNGTEYELPKVLVGANFGYGALSEGSPDLNTYPLFIGQNSGSIIVFTETAGTYSLKIEEPQSGGSSDFSTAEVTVNANKQFEFSVPLINDEFGYFGAYDNINPDESETLTVGLYKGKALTQFHTSGVVSVSGNAQLMNEQILITGDCTITIS